MSNKRRQKRPAGEMGTASRTVTYPYGSYSMRTYVPTGSKFLDYNEFRDKTTGMVATKTYVNNPDWKAKVADFEDAGAAYARTGVTVCVPSKYDGTITGNNSISRCWGSRFGVALVDGADHVPTKDLALARLKNQLNGYIGRENLAPFVAESKQIVGLARQINDLAIRTLKALIDLKRTRGESAWKWAADTWLMFGFGVNPLLSDLGKASTAMVAYQSRQDWKARATGTARTEWLSRGYANTGNIATGAVLDLTCDAVHKLSYRYVAGAQIEILSDANYGYFDQLGLTIGNLPSALWELTVYSWVVDYFSTVGPWLEDMFYTLPGSVRYVYLSKRYEVRVVHRPKVVTTYKWVGTATEGRHNYFSFSRTKLTTLPHRQLRWKNPDEIGKHGITKLMNLGAVLIGLRRGVFFEPPTR